MTFREKLQKEHPESVGLKWDGGCCGCPVQYGYEPRRPLCIGSTCRDCWDREIPGTEPTTDCRVDIYKIIDEAMEKKDRKVSIFVYKDNLSINVEPITDSKPRWILKTDEHGDYKFTCSECGIVADGQTCYCPFCGEKLALHKKEE